MLLNYIKRGLYNTLVYGGSSIFARSINFFIFPFILNYVSLEKLGIWDFYQILFNFCIIFCASWPATSLTRFFLLYKNDETKRNKVVGNSLVFSIALILLGFIFNQTLIAPYYPQKDYFFITCLTIASFSLFSLILTYLKIKAYFTYYSLCYCGQQIISIILTFLGVWLGYGVESFFYANFLSTIFFIPGFICLFIKFFSFCPTLFLTQAKFSLPLVIYSLLFNLLLNQDRITIQYYGGFETLGTYSLLWRFGTLFQFFAIALMDASPFVFYNAQQEKNGDQIIKKLITYYCMLIASSSLLLMVASHCCVLWFFPIKYTHLVNLLPIFFIPLTMVELARILQIGFILSCKTSLLPCLIFAIAAIQYILFYLAKSGTIMTICYINTAAFSLYCFFAALATNNIYLVPIIENKKICKLIAVFFVYVTLLQIYCHYHWLLYCVILSTIPIIFWLLNIIDAEEKQWLLNFILQKKESLQKKATEKKILYLRTDINPIEIKAGGSVSHAMGVIKEFINLEYEVVCASSAIPTILKQMPMKHFTQLKAYPIFFFLRWKLNYLRWQLECFFASFFFLHQIKNLLNQSKFDFIYQRYSLLNFTGVLIKKWKKIPLILEYNGSEVWAYNNWSDSRHWININFLARFVEQLNLQSANHIIAVSEALKEELIKKKINAHKILVNPNGVDIDLFNPEKLDNNRTQIRTKLGIDDQFVFGFCGTFSYWHGIETIVAAVPEIVQKNNNAHFLFIGDGPLRTIVASHLETYIISKKITLTGIIDPKDVPAYLAACDAFLSPTLSNKDGSAFFGSPTKIFEYLSMAKPVIASDLGQISDILSPSYTSSENINNNEITNKLGILIPPNNHCELIKAACSLIKMNDKKRTSIGENARKKALLYTWKQHVYKIHQLINSQ